MQESHCSGIETVFQRRTKQEPRELLHQHFSATSTGNIKYQCPTKEVNNTYVVFALPPATLLPPVEKSKQEVGLSLLVPVCAPADDYCFIKREKGKKLVRQETQHRFGPGEDVKTHITFVLVICSD